METFTQEEVVALIVKVSKNLGEKAGATVYPKMNYENKTVDLYRKGFFKDTHYKSETYDEVIKEIEAL